MVWNAANCLASAVWAPVGDDLSSLGQSVEIARLAGGQRLGVEAGHAGKHLAQIRHGNHPRFQGMQNAPPTMLRRYRMGVFPGGGSENTQTASFALNTGDFCI
jgi:hypothetical protein